MIMLAREHKKFLAKRAKEGLFPKNCVCPGQCKFCYQRDFTKIFPRVKTTYIPQYTKKTFDFFCKKFLAYRKKNESKHHGEWMHKLGGEWTYFPACDFFNLGLTQAQIEKTVQIGGPCYTTGLNADFKFIKYLSRKYPNRFRLHLSIITFDPLIRKNVMNPDIDVENLKRICKVAVRPIFFLFCFNKEQAISDIDILNKQSVRNRGRFYIHKLYYNKFSPKIVKDYATRGEKDFKEVVYYLKMNDKKLNNISNRLSMGPSAAAYAWKFQEKVAQLLERCRETDSGAIFCSVGAYQIIRSIKKKINIIPVENSMGGCVDFAIGITVRSIMHKIREIFVKGMTLREIYLPGSMFVAEKKIDLNGEGIDLIRKEFPDIKIKAIDIPPEITNSTLSLDECFKYYLFHEINLPARCQE
jgi:hypothetical protein